MNGKIKKFERRYSTRLVNKLLDGTSRLLYLHALLEIASDQINYPSADITDRLGLLIDAYLTEARPLIQEITRTSRALQNLPQTDHDSQDTR